MYDATPDGIELHVRLTPGAARDGVDGCVERDDGRTYLAARVRAKPDKGQANTALIKALARWASCAKRDIELLRGSTSRIKTLRLTLSGAARTELIARLEALSHERSTD